VKRGTLGLAAAVLLLTGCMVGPDYRRPAYPLPSTFRSQPAAEGGVSFGDLEWWRIFEDEQLVELIRTALRQNYDLQIAVARVLDARTQVVIARSFLYPTVTAGLSAPYTRFVRSEKERLSEVREDLLAPQGISVWARAQRTLQPWEAWLSFREWVDRDNPRMAFGVARGLVAASTIPESERSWAELMRREARARVTHLLPPGTVLCLPTTPFPAPMKGQSLSALNPVRDRILCLCAHGGLTGVPQVSVPGSTVDGLPVGLSILAGPGADALLAGIALAMTGAS